MKLNKYDLYDLSSILQPQLQKSVELEIKEKIIKRGSLDLFKLELNSNQYEINIFLNRGETNKSEVVKIPYPFLFEYYKEKENDFLYFDYRLSTFCKGENDYKRALKKISNSYKKSKYFDNILVMRFKNI